VRALLVALLLATTFTPELARADGAQSGSSATSAPGAAPVQGGTPASPTRRRRLAWDPAWPRFRPLEYVATGVAGAGALLLFEFGSVADHAKWDGPVLFDKPVRNALRQRGAKTLTNLRSVGDVLTITPVVYVVAVDSLLVPAIDGNADVAWQMTLMNAEAFSLSGLFAWSMFATVGRARPSHRECVAGTVDDPLCKTGTFADFPSGHTTTAFTAAGLTCVHHAHLPLYGGGAADVAACVASLAVGTGAGVFRLLGDRHYASDVIVGAGVGFAIGYGLPSLLHYRGRSLNEAYASPSLKVGVGLGAEGTPAGANVFGIF
jgi:membrane-associated phospholipid phosphatase